MGEKQLKFLEFVPLILYITFVRATGGDSAGPQWRIAFVVGGVLSTVVLIVLLRDRRLILNRIVLGVNLFLITGGIAAVLRLDPLLAFYWRVNPAAMFVWILAVGLVSTVYSPYGFVGSDHPDRKLIRRHSAYLMAAAVVALAVALFFCGKIVYADILPFIGLFIVNDRLRSRHSQATP